VLAINDLFRPCKIRFTLALSDYEVRQSDYLSTDFDPPAANLIVNNRNVKPIELGRRGHDQGFQKLASEQHDRVMILIHSGSEWRWNDRLQSWKYDVGFSHGGDLLAKTGPYLRVTSTIPRNWAHELGHLLGLPHTSKDGYDAPSKLLTSKDISIACEKYLAQGGDIKHPEYAIDGDYQVGVYDTPPDPGLGFWENTSALTKVIQISIAGRSPFSLLVSRNNIMAALPFNGGFSFDQIMVMRKRIALWQARKK